MYMLYDNEINVTNIYVIALTNNDISYSDHKDK